MRLEVLVDDATYPLEIPAGLITQAQDFFQKMDRDMDRGWQMSRDYVERPDAMQRCQIVANRLLTAMENGNDKTALLMAGYILSRMPGVTAIAIDNTGEMQNTEILFGNK